MIKKIEKAKSSRSSCSQCKEKILMGEPRGIKPSITSAFGKTYKSNSFYCKKCTIVELKKSQELIKRLLVQVNQGKLL